MTMGDDWFQLPCALCPAVLQIAPGIEIEPFVKVMGWLAIANDKHLCGGCNAKPHKSTPPKD